MRGLSKGVDWVNANSGKEPFLNLVNSYTKMDAAQRRTGHYRRRAPFAPTLIQLGSFQ